MMQSTNKTRNTIKTYGGTWKKDSLQEGTELVTFFLDSVTRANTLQPSKSFNEEKHAADSEMIHTVEFYTEKIQNQKHIKPEN